MTFGRIFVQIDSIQFETGFLRSMQALAVHARHEMIALNSRTVRQSGATRPGQRPLHLVSTRRRKQRIVLAQAAVDDTANEITTMPVLRARLDVTEQIVTIDAMGCQRTIARQIVDRGGNSVLALKANQPELYDIASPWSRRQRDASDGGEEAWSARSSG